MTRHLAAVPDKPGRVILYVRVSALMGRGGEDFHSPDLQLAAMRRATAGMREVAVIDDDIDVSGRTFDRGGLDRVRQLVEAGQVDAIAVYNLARFGRNTVQGLQFLNWLADRGVTVLSASEHVDTSTPSGRWMLTTMLGLAEMRSDEIGVEWSSTIRQRARSGRPHGPAATGYRRGPDGRLVEDPTAGPAMREFFAGYAAGEDLHVLRRELHAVTGLRLPSTALRKMLTNPTYLGVVRVGRGPGIVEAQGAHEPLMTPDTWEQVQLRIAHTRTEPPRLRTPKYALSGIGVCGLCDTRAHHYLQSSDKDIVRLRCAKQQSALAGCRGFGAPRAAEVEAAVLARIAAHIAKLRGDIGGQTVRRSRARRAGMDAAAVRKELDEIKRAMARAAEALVRERIDDEAYDATMRSLREDEARLASDYSALTREAQVPEPGQIVALGEKLLALWPRMDGRQRNRAMRDLVEAVAIMPADSYRQPLDKRIDPRWR